MVYFREDRRTRVLPAPVPWERVMKQCACVGPSQSRNVDLEGNKPSSLGSCQNKRGMPQVLLFPLSWLACLKWQLFQRFNLKCVFLSWRHFVKKRIIPLWLSSENWVEFISIPLQAYKWKIQKQMCGQIPVWPLVLLIRFCRHLLDICLVQEVCVLCMGIRPGSCLPRSQNVTRKPETVTCPKASLSKYWLY